MKSLRLPMCIMPWSSHTCRNCSKNMSGGGDGDSSEIDQVLHDGQLSPLDLENIDDVNDYLGKKYEIVKRRERIF